MSSGNPNKKGNNRLLWRIHHWAGLYTGILIGVLSLTGAIAVFIPEIDAFIKKVHYNAVSSPSATGRPEFSRSLSGLLQKYPDLKSLSVEIPEQVGEAGEINLFVPTEEGNHTLAFFVDMGNDRVLGSRIHQNSLANYMRQMHVRLYDGYWGRQLVGLGGVALTVLVVTGLLIYGNFMKRQAFPKIRKGRGQRIAWADWHKILGIGALAFNLVIALTGAWLGLQPVLMDWLNMKIPNAYSAEVVMEAGHDRELTVNWDQAFATAHQAFPELQISQASPSVNGSATITFRGSIRGTLYERRANVLVLSKKTLEPVYKYDVREQPAAHKFFYLQEALHFGDFGGLALKLLYAILGLVSGFLSISGFVVYLCRTRKKVPERSSLKITVVYCLVIILLLVIAALVSLFIGYAPAALGAAIFINGLLLALVLSALLNYLFKKFSKGKAAL
ncbi:putative iron-regulated membrane protein [Anseongella ginsenosidimutans]|uniref:Putative iron-regulated membrane protein n=1 Tax=Anseongella ginsenosidimutans TaxID=496056 RepID=A0A4R3KR70_9SPHI|nr:PepSY-associated TM helix domain-containing protein [Anseongella ginsenosidimutans]QEC53014.1 PepSY domain-containing protein [Anseongella ginsenosidimutans]TCS87420.1 putative iron-regulated membrane protein [Anseongella ginsenosidimutans]